MATSSARHPKPSAVLLFVLLPVIGAMPAYVYVGLLVFERVSDMGIALFLALIPLVSAVVIYLRHDHPVRAAVAALAQIVSGGVGFFFAASYALANYWSGDCDASTLLVALIGPHRGDGDCSD